MHDPHSTHTRKNKNQKPIVWYKHIEQRKFVMYPQNK